MAKVALISSAGGHLTEVLALVEDLAGEHEFLLVVTDYPAVRGMRLEGIDRIILAPTLWRNIESRLLKRPRQLAGVALTMVWWLGTFWRLFRRERPDALISVGAEIAVPAYLVNRLFFRRPALYVESLARIQTPSLTGRLVARLADRVFVQWPAVRDRYGPRGEYHGRLT